MKFYGRSSNLTYNDHNIFHEGYKPSWNLKINDDVAGQQVSAGDAVTIKKGNGINITRDGSNVTVSNTLAAGDGITLTGTTFKAVAGLGMLVNSSGIHTIFGGNGTENTSARSDHNHNDIYDNYGGFNIKVNTETTGQKIDSEGEIVIKQSGATTVSRSGNILTISSTDTKYSHPTTTGNKHIPSGGATNNFLQWASDGTATWSTVDWSEISGKPTTFEPSAHNHDDRYLKLSGGTLTGTLKAANTLTVENSSSGVSEFLISRAASGTRSWRFRNEGGTFSIDNKLLEDSTWGNSLMVKTGELTELYVGGTKVSKVGHTHNYADSNHTHPYDNYGGFFLKSSNETGNGKHITSAETISFKAGTGVSISRTNGEITVNATLPTASDIGAIKKVGDVIANRVATFNDINGNVKDSGFTIATSVPANAKFTDTNTWRDCIDNLTSVDIDKSLSANQGKILKGLIDGKADSSHGNHWNSKPITTNFETDFRLQTYGSTASGNYLSVIRNSTSGVTNAPTHGSGIAFGYSDTHSYLYTSYSSAEAYLGGGNSGKLNWVKRIAFTDSSVASAGKWTTARTLTIGNAGKSVDGSTNVSWTLAEIGAASSTHTHNYLSLSGGTLTGALTLNANPTSDLQAATKSYVDEQVNALLGSNDAMIFKGTIGTGGTVTALPEAPQKGWTYRVITAGTYLGHKCEVGDLIIAIGTTNVSASWTVAQTNIDGAVTSSATKSVTGNLACFDGSTGKIIKDSSVSYGDLVLTPGDIKANQILKYDGKTWVAASTDSIGLPDATNNKGKYLRLNSTTGATEWYSIPNATTSVIGLTRYAVPFNEYKDTTTPYFNIDNLAMTPKAVKSAIDMASNERRKVLTGPYDLNDLKTNGTYVTDSDSNTGTILNKPEEVNKGFYLEVYIIWEETGSAPRQRVMQRITTREGVIYTRGFDENGVWFAWRRSWDTGNLGTVTVSANGIMTKEDKAKLDSIGGIITATKSLTLTTNWQDYGISGDNIATGSYMIQIQPTTSSVTGMEEEIHTGMMSWYSGTTNSTDGDEIILHAAGKNSGGQHIYLRTVRSASNGKMKLQIAFSKTATTATNVVIKFRKLI